MPQWISWSGLFSHLMTLEIWLLGVSMPFGCLKRMCRFYMSMLNMKTSPLMRPGHFVFISLGIQIQSAAPQGPGRSIPSPWNQPVHLLVTVQCTRPSSFTSSHTNHVSSSAGISPPPHTAERSTAEWEDSPSCLHTRVVICMWMWVSHGDHWVDQPVLGGGNEPMIPFFLFLFQGIRLWSAHVYYWCIRGWTFKNNAIFNTLMLLLRHYFLKTRYIPLVEQWF